MTHSNNDDECGVCNALCSLIGDETGRCDELAKRYTDGEISASEFDEQLKEEFGTAKVDLAKGQIQEEIIDERRKSISRGQRPVEQNEQEDTEEARSSEEREAEDEENSID